MTFINKDPYYVQDYRYKHLYRIYNKGFNVATYNEKKDELKIHGVFYNYGYIQELNIQKMIDNIKEEL